MSKFNLEKATRFNILTPQLKKILNGEMTAFYLRCEMLEKPAMIMDYARFGKVKDSHGTYCPKRGEWLERIVFNGRDGAYAQYASGKLQCVKTIKMLANTNVYYFPEKYVDLSDYGLPRHILYEVDNNSDLTITKNGITKKVVWKSIRSRNDARYFMGVDDVVIKPVLDITEEEARSLGFEPSNEPLLLPHGLTLQIDDGETARNAFFQDYYRRAGEELRNDPYIYYIKFKLIRR